MYVCAHIVPDDLSKRLRQILDLRGWTPYELSQKSGLESDNHVQVILSRGAKRPSALTLYQIARGANVSLEWLISGEGTPEGTARPRFCDLPGWSDALKSARVLEPLLPDWVWQAVSVARPWLDAPLSPRLVADAAKFVFANYLPPHEIH